MNYSDYEALIHSRVRSWHSTTGLDYEDCLSIANQAFAEACYYYKPEKGKFSTYLWLGIDIQFNSYLKHHRRWLAVDVTERYEELATTNGQLHHLMDKLLDLSGRSQKIVKYILQNPDKFCYKGNQVTRSNGELAGKIAKMGFSWRTARRIINEIKQCLQEESNET